MVLRVLSGSLWGEGVRGARTSQDNEIDKEAIDVWAEIIYHITFFSLEQHYILYLKQTWKNLYVAQKWP